MPAIQLDLILHQTQEGLSYQHLRIQFTTENGVIAPQDLQGLTLPPEIRSDLGIGIEGKGPLWLYSYLVNECQDSLWIGCYDPRLGIVVVDTQTPAIAVGSVLPVDLPQ